MKNNKIEIHALHSFAANAVNRGEFGEVKSFVMGGMPRVMMSSQSIKSAIKNNIADFHIRTNYYLNEIMEECCKIQPELATDQDFLKMLKEASAAKLKEDKKNPILLTKSQTTESTSYEEITDIAKIIVNEYKNGGKADTLKKKLLKMDIIPDLWNAAFGRMGTTNLFKTIEGAVQFGNSYSVDVHRNQTDYFTVVDSLQKKYDPNNAGAANMQLQAISANTMYRYMCIDITQYLNNAKIAERLTIDDVHKDPVAIKCATFIADLMLGFMYIHPVAKQHSMASVPTPSMVLIATGQNTYNMDMGCAFNKIVQQTDNASIAENALRRVVNWTENDMLCDQYDSAELWIQDSEVVKDSNTVKTNRKMNGVYKYIKNDIYKKVMDCIQQLKSN